MLVIVLSFLGRMEKLNFSINFLPEKFLKSMFFNVTKLNFFSNAKYSCNRQYADWPPSGKGRANSFSSNPLYSMFFWNIL